MKTHLTDRQKMFALSNAMYQGGQKWIPKAGDYYTSSRPDLELYQIYSVQNGKVLTRYTNGHSAISEWDEEGFLTEGFGPNRIHVPEWIFSL